MNNSSLSSKAVIAQLQTIYLVFICSLTALMSVNGHAYDVNGKQTIKSGTDDERDTIHVVADSWCPYNCEPNSPNPGYLIELMEVVFHPLGYLIDYKLVPWQRALDLTAEGKTDAAVGAVQGNHGKTIIGNESLGSDETVFVVKKEKAFTYEGIDSLSALRLGFISNYTYDNKGPIDQYLQDRVANGDNIITVHNSKPLKSLFLMLNAGRIDAFPENKYVAEFMAMNTQQTQQYQFISSNSDDDVFIAFSPTTRGKQLCKALDQAVARMKRDGSLAALQARYGISSE